MRRHDDKLDQALKKLNHDVIWLPSRFEKHKEVLSSKLNQRSVNQMSRQQSRRWIPIVVTVIFLGVFATFMFNTFFNDQRMAIDNGEEQQTDASEEQSAADEHDLADAEQREDDPVDSETDVDQDEPRPPLADQFEQEKEIEIMLEGMPEMIQVQLETNDDWRYIIYVDKDRYVFNQEGDADRIELKEPIDMDLPEIAMEIRRLQDGTEIDDAVQLITEEIEADGLDIERQEEIDWPFAALSIVALGEERTEHGKFGHQWDTPVHQYYIVQGETGELFVLKQMYFLEAAEGHGSRFDQMLETFQIVP